jgi:hypothetical protein
LERVLSAIDFGDFVPGIHFTRFSKIALVNRYVPRIHPRAELALVYFTWWAIREAEHLKFRLWGRNLRLTRRLTRRLPRRLRPGSLLRLDPALAILASAVLAGASSVAALLADFGLGFTPVGESPSQQDCCQQQSENDG